MSTPTEHGAGHGHGHGVRSEEDRISTPAILGVGIASLLVFFVASFVTGRYWLVRGEAHGPIAIPAEVGQNKIGMVEQQLFNSSKPLRGERLKAVQQRRLGSYGWVDRAAGIAHVPIDDAMGLVARGVRPMPVVPPEAASAAPPGGQP